MDSLKQVRAVNERRGKKLASLLVVTVAVFALVFGLVGCSCAPEEAAVPDVVGMTKADAEKVIKDNKFQVGTITEEASAIVPEGSVISQDPESGKEVQVSSKINLVVSKGSDAKVKVPDLNGMRQSEAEEALIKIGLVPVPLDPEENNSAPGKVFKQSVAAGSEVQVGTRVNFTVALGSESETIPDVVGKTEVEALDILHKTSFGVDLLREYNGEFAAGVVCGQSPSAGTKVVHGTRVAVVISLGAAPEGKVEVPNFMTFTLDEAKSAAASAGLELVATGETGGKAIEQNPVAGTKVDKGTKVEVEFFMVVEEE